MLPRSGETRCDAQPGRPGTATNVVRARQVSDNDVSNGAAPSIVGEEKVHAPVSSVRAGAGQEVALFAADTEGRVAFPRSYRPEPLGYGSCSPSPPVGRSLKTR